MAALDDLHAVVVKGIQTAEDARLCAENGAEALVVSNHGGHALEGTEGSIDMLPSIADAVGDRLEVYLDGGVRKGADVLKALVLGLGPPYVGRPVFWGLSVGGEEGVTHCLEILRNELNIAMGLCGVTDVKQVDRSVAQYPGANTASVVGDLDRLTRLLDQGYLTREEFETQKSRPAGVE